MFDKQSINYSLVTSRDIDKHPYLTIAGLTRLSIGFCSNEACRSAARERNANNNMILLFRRFGIKVWEKPTINAAMQGPLGFRTKVFSNKIKL